MKPFASVPQSRESIPLIRGYNNMFCDQTGCEKQPLSMQERGLEYSRISNFACQIFNHHSKVSNLIS